MNKKLTKEFIASKEGQLYLCSNADKRVIDVCKTFNEVQTGPNPLTVCEIQTLINKRTSMYYILQNYVDKNTIKPVKFYKPIKPIKVTKSIKTIKPIESTRPVNSIKIKPIPKLPRAGIPMFNTHDVHIYYGNALQLLYNFPSSSIDMIFADPPYFLSNDGFTCNSGTRVSVNKGDWDRTDNSIMNNYRFYIKWIKACKRLLKPHGTLWISGTYHSVYMAGWIAQKLGWHFINDVVWFKPNAPPNLSCRMFTASHETLLWLKPDKTSKHIFNYEDLKHGDFPKDILKNPNKQMRSVWSISAGLSSHEKHYGKHPTQKPESLLERIIMACTHRGHIILDPFCGSGTTGVVALRLGRRFIGIDSDKGYLEQLAIPRIKDEINKQR